MNDDAPIPSSSEMPETGTSNGTKVHPLLLKTNAFPHLPGVYLFKDANGTVLYVGKAKDLKKRVSSYFRGTGQGNVKTRVLLTKAADLEYVITATEKEALLLEAGLIKKHRPRYNVILRDDKNYPALRIDLRQPYPRLEVVRRFNKDGALYFGPYPSGYAVPEVLKLLNGVFPLRQCKSKKLIRQERPCLNYSLGRCLGACAGKVTPEEYHKVVNELVLFLQGKTDVFQQQLQRQMEEAAEALDFEKAAFYRDRLRSAASMLEKQHVVSDRFLNQDVLGMYREENHIELVVLFVRQGMLLGQKYFDFTPPLEKQRETQEILTTFIQQYYGENQYIPDEILIPASLETGEALEEWLTEVKGKKVQIRPAQRGDRRSLLDLAQRNAEERFRSRRKWQENDQRMLEQLQQVLKLPKVPRRMACVDISNLQGRHAVGAVVIFTDGQADRPLYRRYRVEGKEKPDDPAMMAEIMERFFGEEPELASSLDLLVVDGGKGQLNRIGQLLINLNMADRLPVIGIAKEREADRGQEGKGFYEKIYIPGRKNPLYLTTYPHLLHLLQRLRDEAHHTAVSFYQQRHRQDLFVSALDDIPGVGFRRRQRLLQHFGSFEAVQRADLQALHAVPGISATLAETIFRYLHASESVSEEDPGSS